MLHTAGEQMLSEMTAVLFGIYPQIDADQVKSELSAVLTKYHVQKVEEDEVHPDLHDKIKLFLAGKQLEGLSKITIDGYRLQLGIFARQVKKRVGDISAADIRVYLGQYKHQKRNASQRHYRSRNLKCCARLAKRTDKEHLSKCYTLLDADCQKSMG